MGASKGQFIEWNEMELGIPDYAPEPIRKVLTPCQRAGKLAIEEMVANKKKEALLSQVSEELQKKGGLYKIKREIVKELLTSFSESYLMGGSPREFYVSENGDYAAQTKSGFRESIGTNFRWIDYVTIKNPFKL